MTVIDVIKKRRSIGRVKEEDVPDDVIRTLLDAAVWAPNHRKTEPWKFRVIKGDARVKLGEKMAEITAKGLEGTDREEAERKIEKAKKNPLRAPAIIVIAASPTGKVPEIEEIVACGCAMQNLLLAATEMGLATYVRTGDIAFSRELHQYLQLDEKDQIIGMVYIGYPEKELDVKGIRTPAEEKTVWFH